MEKTPTRGAEKGGLGDGGMVPSIVKVKEVDIQARPQIVEVVGGW